MPVSDNFIFIYLLIFIVMLYGRLNWLFVSFLSYILIIWLDWLVLLTCPVTMV